MIKDLTNYIYGVLFTVAFHERPCALRAPTVFLVRIETIRTKNTVMDKSKDGLEVAFVQDRNSATTGRRNL